LGALAGDKTGTGPSKALATRGNQELAVAYPLEEEKKNQPREVKC